MSAIIVPIEIQLTERSQAILAALSGAIGTSQAAPTTPTTASTTGIALQPSHRSQLGTMLRLVRGCGFQGTRRVAVECGSYRLS